MIYFFSTKAADCVFREVYEGLVADGVVIPKPEEAPPTVPMDYNWARVSVYSVFILFICRT